MLPEKHSLVPYRFDAQKPHHRETQRGTTVRFMAQLAGLVQGEMMIPNPVLVLLRSKKLSLAEECHLFPHTLLLPIGPSACSCFIQRDR